MSGPWTNQVVSQVVLITEPGGLSQILFTFPALTNVSDGILEGGTIGSGATTEATIDLIGPAQPSSTANDAVFLQFASNTASGSMSAGWSIDYVSTSGTGAVTQTQLSANGLTGVVLSYVNDIYGLNPGASGGTAFGYPLTKETWHQVSSFSNGYAASGSGVNGAFYRYLPLGDGVTEIIADITTSTATGNSVAFVLPSQWRPNTNQNHPGAWNNPGVAGAPWIFVDTSGNVQVTGVNPKNIPVFFHIFVPLTLTA